jgi:hypothetical protein
VPRLTLRSWTPCLITNLRALSKYVARSWRAKHGSPEARRLRVEISGPSVDVQWQILVQLLNIGAVLLAVILTVRATANFEARRISRTIAPLARIEIKRIQAAIIGALETETDPVEVRGIGVSREGAILFSEHGNLIGALPPQQAEAIMSFYARFLATRSRISHESGVIVSEISLHDAKAINILAHDALNSLGE